MHKARIVLFGMNMPAGSGALQDQDWFFEGDASVLLPKMLDPFSSCYWPVTEPGLNLLNF